MLIRRTIKPTPPPTVENHVTVVRPRRHTALLAGLGVTTLLSIGALMYLAWYLPPSGTEDLATPAVIVAPTGRAQRFTNPNPAATPPPTTIIVTPPPVVAEPVHERPTPVPAKQPPIIVDGSSSEPPPVPDTVGTGDTKGEDPERNDDSDTSTAPSAPSQQPG